MTVRWHGLVLTVVSVAATSCHGRIGAVCDSDDDCAGSLTCMPIPSEVQGVPPTMTCTRACSTDDDCEHEPREPGGYCDTDGVCERRLSK